MNHGWRYRLHHWVTIDQNTRNPFSPDHSVNCGPACTAAMGRWMTGRHFDPEQIRVQAGDAVGQNTGTGPEVDEWFFGPQGPVRAPVRILSPSNPRGLAFELYEALRRHHAAKVLQWYDENETERHFRVVHAGMWDEHIGEPVYLLGDPWTGSDVAYSISELWSLYQGLVIVPMRHRQVK